MIIILPMTTPQEFNLWLHFCGMAPKRPPPLFIGQCDRCGKTLSSAEPFGLCADCGCALCDSCRLPCHKRDGRQGCIGHFCEYCQFEHSCYRYGGENLACGCRSLLHASSSPSSSDGSPPLGSETFVRAAVPGCGDRPHSPPENQPGGSEKQAGGPMPKSPSGVCGD